MSNFNDNIKKRYTVSNLWNIIFTFATIVAVFMLFLLLMNIINGAFGYVAIENTIEPTELISSGNLDELDESQLIEILETNLSKGLIRRYNFENPLIDRSKTEIMSLVFERIIEPRVVKSWNLKESILGRNAILVC